MRDASPRCVGRQQAATLERIHGEVTASGVMEHADKG